MIHLSDPTRAYVFLPWAKISAARLSPQKGAYWLVSLNRLCLV